MSDQCGNVLEWRETLFGLHHRLHLHCGADCDVVGSSKWWQMTQDKFWQQKTAKQCAEYMAHEAMAEVERLRHLLTVPGIREQTRHAARVAIRNHMAYARQVAGEENGQ